MREAGRAFRSEAVAIAKSRDDGLVDLCSPSVGFFREGPRAGEVLVEGSAFGELEVLGLRVALKVPAVRGAVVEASRHRAVGYGEPLVTIDPRSAAGGAEVVAQKTASADTSSSLVFRFATSGRYYARPAPGADPFVAIGAVISAGQTVALLEVMKTFNRIQYGGDDVPERARVVEIFATHDSDVSAGDALLRVEPA
jgi:acetyl-CoA carboxylase biotin carboxyl carrier protein